MSLDSVCSIWSGRSAACSIKASASLNRSLIWQSPLSLLPAPAGLLRSTMQWQRHTCYTVGIAPPASATSALRGTSAILMMPSPLPPTPALPLTFGCLRSPDSRITPTVCWALCRHWTSSGLRGAADPAPDPCYNTLNRNGPDAEPHHRPVLHHPPPLRCGRRSGDLPAGGHVLHRLAERSRIRPSHPAP